MSIESVPQGSAKPKLVYILGTGHSGSTLLELILSTDPNTVSLGGFRYLDFYLKGERGVTHDDAGFVAAESPMWAPIAEAPEKFIKAEPIEPTLSFKNRLSILLRGEPTVVPHRYQNDCLYRFVQRQASDVYDTQIEVIVDSSKTLARLLELEYNCSYDVYVIHLVRDVRGVVNSNRKLGKSTFASIRYWLTDNLYAARFLRRSIPAERWRRLRYEDLVADPEEEIAKLNHWLGLEIDMHRLVDNINNQQSFRFAGNTMRHKKFEGIRTDASWKQQLPKYLQILLSIPNLFFK